MIKGILKFIFILIGTVGALYVFRLYPQTLNFVKDNWLIIGLVLLFITYGYVNKLYDKIKSGLSWDIFLYFKPEWVNGISLGLLSFLIIDGIVSESLGWIILRVYVLFLVIQFYFFYKPLLDENNDSSLLSTVSFYQIIGKTQPIENDLEDKFKVSKWVNKIANLLLNNRDSQLIIGINGKWGAGKTSLINLIIKELPKNSYLIFSSWNYLNNSNLSEHLMYRIGCQLDQLTKKVNFFSKLFNSIHLSVSNSPDSSFNFLYKTTFNLFSNDAKEELNTRLKSDLSQPLVVFIDDLDRLEKNEFIKVIRSIYILSDLTKIRFVLAYDKHHVLSLLFPGKEIVKSIDFFSKLINFEFNLNIHSEPMRRDFCIDMILKLQEFFPMSSELKFFESFFKDDQLTYYLFKLLETPRELRKILAYSIWSSLDAKGNFIFNPVDMFILTTIQHRIPNLYKAFQENAEEIKNQLCIFMKLTPLNYAPSLANSKKGTINESKEAILNSLFGVNEDSYTAKEIDIINDLLEKLFPPLFDVSPNTDEVLKEKRISYPSVFETYLHLEVDNLSIQYIGLVEEFKNANPDNHKEYAEFFKRNKKLLREHRIWNDFLKYNLYQKDPKYIESFLKGLFEISKEFESDEFHLLNTEADIYSRRTCQLIAALINKKYSNKNLIGLVRGIADLKPSYGIFSFLIHNIKKPDLKLKNTNLNLNPNEIGMLDNVLRDYAQDYFFNSKVNFSKYDFCGLIYWTQIDESLKEQIIRLIKSKQDILFWILDFFFRFSFSNSDLEHLDAIIGFTILRRIIAETVKFDLLSENEKKLIKNFTEKCTNHN